MITSQELSELPEQLVKYRKALLPNQTHAAQTIGINRTTLVMREKTLYAGVAWEELLTMLWLLEKLIENSPDLV